MSRLWVEKRYRPLAGQLPEQRRQRGSGWAGRGRRSVRPQIFGCPAPASSAIYHPLPAVGHASTVLAWRNGHAQQLQRASRRRRAVGLHAPDPVGIGARPPALRMFAARLAMGWTRSAVTKPTVVARQGSERCQRPGRKVRCFRRRRRPVRAGRPRSRVLYLYRCGRSAAVSRPRSE